MPEDQIAEIERRGTSQRRLVIRAPRGGELAEKMVTEGQAVQAGDNLFLIADRTVLWVDLAVFESDARVLRVGTPVSRATGRPARPDLPGPGELHPAAGGREEPHAHGPRRGSQSGRHAPARHVRDGRARRGESERLSVPITAVLPTGTRELVFVNRGDGAFVPREVKIGVRGDSLVEIVTGLKPGDEVVASATYLLDSETNLASAMQGLMLQMGMGLDMGGMDMGGGQAGGRARGQDSAGPEKRR